MGYFFTLLYILTAYLTPQVVFGSLSEFHVEVLVVFFAVIFSIPAVPRSGLMRSWQMLAFAGMTMAVVISIAQTGWLGGALSAGYGFLQPSFGFILVALNCRTKRHLQLIVLGLVVATGLFMVAGILDLRANVMPSPFIYGEGDLRRIRGLGFVNDPNDFSQMMVALIPAIFLWQQRGALANVFVLGPPLLMLLTGMYLTHSRGGAVALMAVIVVSARRKIGTVFAVVIAGLLFVGAFAVGWSGGRDVSMEAGADRLDLWYDGIQVIKAHPLFGVGMGGFTDQFGITAHNSVIVCAAEIGMIGLFFWVLLMFSTIRQGVLLGKAGVPEVEDETEAMGRYGSAAKMAWDEPGEETEDTAEDEVALGDVVEEAAPVAISGFAVKEMTHDEIRTMVRILIVSVTGFLTAGWFLSRALSLWLFMFCGMIFAVIRMGAERGLTIKKDGGGFMARWTFAITCALVVLVSLIVRFRYL